MVHSRCAGGSLCMTFIQSGQTTEGAGIRAFLVAENRLLREALGRVLRRRNDVEVTSADALDGAVQTQIRQERPQVLVVEYGIVADRDLQMITRLQRDAAPLGILVIGMPEDQNTFLRCVRAGVTGYLMKDACASEVVAALRTIADGGTVCPPSFCKILFHTVSSAGTWPGLRPRQSCGLTRRQQQL